MVQNPAPRLILASASRSRRALLQAAGLRFEVLPAQADESSVKQEAQQAGRTAAATALALADLKAGIVARHHPDALVIGADQILVCGGTWFDKPADTAAAKAQLMALRGRPHTLATGVACHCGADRVWQYCAEPSLVMRHFSDIFLDAYVAAEGAAVTSTVGAYRLEGLGVHLFERIEGDHAAILGLPLLPLLAFLREYGVLAG